MSQPTLLPTWIAFWAIQVMVLIAVEPVLGTEAAVVLTVFLTGLTGGALTALRREKRR